MSENPMAALVGPWEMLLAQATRAGMSREAILLATLQTVGAIMETTANAMWPNGSHTPEEVVIRSHFLHPLHDLQRSVENVTPLVPDEGGVGHAGEVRKAP